MSNRLFIGLGIGMIFMLDPRASNAGQSFSFEFDRTNYVVAPGGVVNVQVLLRQSGVADAGDTNILGGLGAVGMTGTGVRVTFGAGANDAQVLSPSDIAGNPGFDNFGFPPFTSASSGSALLSQSTSGTPLLGQNVAPDTYDLLLGTFTFTVGSVPGQVTTIGASIPLSPNSSDNIAATSPDPTVLTNIASAGATITVQGGGLVPEPSSLLLGALASVVVVSLLCRPGTCVRARQGTISEV